MKRTLSFCAAALLALGLTTSASAGGDWRHERGAHRGHERMQHFDRNHHHHMPAPHHRPHYAPPVHHHHERDHRREHRRDWIGPAAVLTIGGIALGSALYYNQQNNASPAVIYQNTPNNGEHWFYCRSSGQYYPNTQACPEGWVTIRR
ncbi:hypothetical protein [Azonexus sp.]|uniref:hypothetical protein n=1 Tax=Azonexus sp. TaxID=1872668 RepID=UPI0039E2ED98